MLLAENTKENARDQQPIPSDTSSFLRAIPTVNVKEAEANCTMHQKKQLPSFTAKIFKVADKKNKKCMKPLKYRFLQTKTTLQL